MNVKTDIRQMMEDVRKAHRLIYQFQDRMIQLTNRIANDYGLSHPVGRKRFSNPSVLCAEATTTRRQTCVCMTNGRGTCSIPTSLSIILVKCQETA